MSRWTLADVFRLEYGDFHFPFCCVCSQKYTFLDGISYRASGARVLQREGRLHGGRYQGGGHLRALREDVRERHEEEGRQGRDCFDQRV